MRLVLTKPAFCPVYRLEEGPACVTDERSILIGPMQTAASSVNLRIARAIALEKPPFTIAEVVRASEVHSLLRWNVDIVESHIIAGTLVVERRLTFIYRFFEWSVPVVFRSAPDIFEDEVGRAETVLASARPDWSGGIVALSELFE